MLFVESRNSLTTREKLQASTEFFLVKTASNAVPILSVSHTSLQPVGVSLEPILFISLSRDSFAGAFTGDNEREDGEAEDDDDQEEH